MANAAQHLMNYADYLQRWRNAGLIDEATAEAIRVFESAKPPEAPSDRPSFVEAILYLGLIVVAVGVVTLLGQHWEDLQSSTRLLVIAVPAALALGLGFALRATGDEAFVRGGHITWFLAVGLVFGAFLVGFHEWGASDDDRNGLLAGGFVALALALTLWAVSGSVPQLVALGGAIVVFGQSLGAWPDDYSTAVAGTAALAGGAIAIGLTELRIFVPRAAAAALFALVAAAGAYESGIDGTLAWAETLSFVVAVALIAAGVIRASFGYLVVGVGLAFLSLVTLMFEHFESDLGAPVALIISGALLVAAVLALIPLRRVVASSRHA
jgi:hypothetical protein